MSKEYLWGWVSAGYGVGAPTAALSIPPILYPSSPEHVEPLRQESVLGIPHFFDHAGNLVNGTVSAMVVVGAGAVIEHYVKPEHQRKVIVASAITAAIASSGVNVIYEAGVDIPYYGQKLDPNFDAADATYGSVAGTLFSLVFCAVALGLKSRRAK